LRRPRWSGEPHATAGAVADALLREYQAGTRGIPAIDATAWTTLKQQIALHPVYIAGPAGVLGSFFGPTEYTHDG
jgi:hypothetical protein